MSTEGTSPPKHALPRHLAIIMDGNGRWAEEHALPRLKGHQEGAQSVRDIVRASRQMGLEAITLYAFSSQNWGRPASEVKGLMELLRDYLIEERPEIMENGIRLRAIGNLSRLPTFVREPLDALMEDSKHHRDMTLTLALSYGGRESIIQTVKTVTKLAAAGEINIDHFNIEEFSGLLPTGELPPLDLVIRTSGEIRISNFLLWEAAYAELYFTNILWPEFRREALYKALDAYAQRQRRFGLVGSQIESGGDLAPDLKNQETL